MIRLPAEALADAAFRPATVAHAEVEIDGICGRLIDLPALLGPLLPRLPVVHRLLLENVLRCMQGEERETAAQALVDWLQSGRSEVEIAFQPGRVLMHDTTSTPALVDIAGLRDTLAEHGADPSRLNPVLPVDVSVDHSLAVEVWGCADAAPRNLAHEMRRNAERYAFLRWASRSLDRVTIHPPGTGIMHTLNLEQLATVVTTETRDGATWFVPDMMIGTDSHTPMVNGIGVLGWGVGGLEAQTVMFGLPTMLRIPEVIGVQLTGRLRPGVQATDLALTVTQRLRALGVAGEFIEFFGPGVATLDADARAVVANMAPEYGATTGFFPADAQVVDYLRRTGRSAPHAARVEAVLKRQGLWFDPQAEPCYTQRLTIDLDAIGLHIAGPQRPQDLRPLGAARPLLAALGFQPRQAMAEAATPSAATAAATLPRHAIAYAAITSCTNTSSPALLVAAGLLARKARALGLKPPAWVKTSLSPGSPSTAGLLQRAGLDEDLAAVGFDIVGYGCATCIGNPGPLPEVIRAAQADGRIRAVAVLSGNRNFPGRVHPDLDLGWLMSPPLVVAFALVGDAERDLEQEPVGHTPDGRPVMLSELWPEDAEVARLVDAARLADDVPRAFALAGRNPSWAGLDAPATARFPWRDRSTQLRRPPFAGLDWGSQLGRYEADPLLVLGDDVTTDHISPASAIPPDSLVADFLVARGEDRGDLNVFASRRGNWEVMLRAAFHNRSLRNLLAPTAPVAHTVHVPSGEIAPLWEVAERYRAAGRAVVLVAGERYGTGSSRDWAAKGQRLLGIRAVLANSFERIHRSNLIGMGILPLRLPAGTTPATLALQAGDTLTIDAPAERLQPRTAVQVTLTRRDGTRLDFSATAAVETQLEVSLLQAGGVMPAILRRTLDDGAATPVAAAAPERATLSPSTRPSPGLSASLNALADTLAPGGPLRACINLGNPILAHRRADGSVGGVSVDLATELARRIGRPLQTVVVEAAGTSVETVRADGADVGFFAIDPLRGQGIGFTGPYVLIEGAWLVREDSPLRDGAEVDRAAHRVVVGRGSAYDLYLTRELKAATILRAATSPTVVDTFLAEGAEVAAGVRQQLEADAARWGGLRLLPGHFMVIRQAMGLPAGRGPAAAAALADFVEEMKASGFVAEALGRHGIDGAAVAPAGGRP
jgi:aconitate hydratase